MGDARMDTLRNEEIKKKAGKADWLLESLDLLDAPSVAAGLSSNGDCSIDLSQVSEEQIEEQRAKVVAEVITSTLRNDFPRHISELDGCNHLLIKYEPELDPMHPGFHDLEYRARRKAVAQIAFNYKHGEKIPQVEYDPREVQTWGYIYERLKVAYAKYACDKHNQALEELEREGGYSAKSIPQLQQVSEYLHKKTGWQLRPAAGLLSARDFLASLAFRVFQTTQYIRHWGNPEHSVEPDCIHELMGHIPMLCDPVFARFSQEIGLASLGASDLEIERFATLYWFTVEFGLCRDEHGQLKCYGAGLLSSYGEMEHALESGLPELKEFVAEETALVEYNDAEYQVVYYVAQSFEDAKEKIKQYAAKHLDRPYELVYDPYTCSIHELDTLGELAKLSDSIQADSRRLQSAIDKLTVKEEKQQQQQQDRSMSVQILNGIGANNYNSKPANGPEIINKLEVKSSAPPTTVATLTNGLGKQLQNGLMLLNKITMNGHDHNNGSNKENQQISNEARAKELPVLRAHQRQPQQEQSIAKADIIW